MKTSEFISVLRAAPNNQLVFLDFKGHAVHCGYHLTELKAASFETVDCGGQTLTCLGSIHIVAAGGYIRIMSNLKRAGMLSLIAALLTPS